MELREKYYRTLEKVLTYLQETKSHNASVNTKEVKSISGDYWDSIKEYMKIHNVSSFASGLVWQVNRERLNQSLAEVRIELDKYKQQRKATVNDRIWQVVLLFLDAVIAFYAGWLLRGCTPEHKTASESPDPCEQSVIIADSIPSSATSSDGLNADSVPSRARSRTVISDSSASTLRK